MNLTSRQSAAVLTDVEESCDTHANFGNQRCRCSIYSLHIAVFFRISCWTANGSDLERIATHAVRERTGYAQT
jgi:hypothetical protein